MPLADFAFQRCISPACGYTCGAEEVRTACPKCGDLLDVAYDWNKAKPPKSLKYFEEMWSRRNEPLRFSGIYRFHELLPFATPDSVVTVGEGQTLLQHSESVAQYVGLKGGRLYLQYEGMNPSGSFKDNGMSAAFTHARAIGARRAACASTGNTSASLAMYCAVTRLMKAVIFIGSGKISYGKLSQALDYGALTIQIAGDFDDAMVRVQEVCRDLGMYLVNSVNPFRLEGQKTIMFRVLEALRWEVPDWIVVPGGNLGNSSAFGKAFAELKMLGLIDRMPRLAVINASGADTLFELYEHRGLRWNGGSSDMAIANHYFAELDQLGRKASTIASAIEINRPVNLRKCLRALHDMNGVVRQVSDQEMLDAKAKIAAGGFGCEPASAASVAGARLLCDQGVIGADERVVCILTGHQLKDPTATVAYHTTDQDQFNKVLGSRGVRRASFANRAVAVANDLGEIVKAIQLYSQPPIHVICAHPRLILLSYNAAAMYLRLAKRLLLETDKRLLWKLAWNFGFKGIRAVQKHKSRLKRGEFFPPFLYISVINSCNLRCQGCWVDVSAKQAKIEPAAMNRLIGEAKAMGNSFFGILGGEPFMHPEILEILGNHRDCYFQVFTNGHFITDEVAKKLREFGNVTPLISVEGNEIVSDERRGREGVFSQTMVGLQNCLKHKVMTGVCTSLCQTNFELLSEKWLDRLIEMGVMYTWFHIYRPVGPDAKPELSLTPEQQLQCRKFVVEMRAKKPIVIIDAYYDGEGRALCPAATGFTHHISPWGDIEPCPVIQFAKESIYDERPLREVFQQSEFLRDFRHTAAEHTRGCIVLERPDLLEQLVARHGAKDTTARHAAGAELDVMQLRPSQYNPGHEIPEKSLAYRIAKYFFFNDYGTYGEHFDAAKWIDSREKPLPKPKLMQIEA